MGSWVASPLPLVAGLRHDPSLQQHHRADGHLPGGTRRSGLLEGHGHRLVHGAFGGGIHAEQRIARTRRNWAPDVELITKADVRAALGPSGH